MPPPGASFACARRLGLLFISLIEMEITQEQLTQLRELIEDSVEYFCDQNLVSGQVAWTCVETLGTAKLVELEGLLAAG